MCPFVASGLADDEGLDLRQDLVHGRAVGERAVRSRVHAEQAVESGGVPGLDGMDRESRGENVRALDLVRLAEICRRAEVLDGRGKREDALGILERELRLRLRCRRAAELFHRLL